jgi:hypothetical protein
MEKGNKKRTDRTDRTDRIDSRMMKSFATKRGVVTVGG